MTMDVIRIAGYLVGVLAIAALVLLLDWLLSRLANRFAGRQGDYGQRIGTQLPRLSQ